MTEEHTKITKPGAQYFPLVDRLPAHQLIALREKDYACPLLSGTIAPGVDIMARWTGEERPPKQGEWYLSGAIIGAYRAPNDWPQVCHIAEVVVVKTTTTVVRDVIDTLAPAFITPPDMLPGDTIERADGHRNRFVVERTENPSGQSHELEPGMDPGVVWRVFGRPSGSGRMIWFWCGEKSQHLLYSRATKDHEPA